MVSPTRHGTTILDACGHSSTCSQACAQQCSTVTTRPHDVSDHGTAHGCTHPVVDTPATITSESSSSPDAQATTAAGASAGPPCAAELWQANGGSHASVAPLHKSISCRDPSPWYTNMLCLYCIATCTHPCTARSVRQRAWPPQSSARTPQQARCGGNPGRHTSSGTYRVETGGGCARTTRHNALQLNSHIARRTASETRCALLRRYLAPTGTRCAPIHAPTKAVRAGNTGVSV